jgi:hypothetical protein
MHAGDRSQESPVCRFLVLAVAARSRSSRRAYHPPIAPASRFGNPRGGSVAATRRERPRGKPDAVRRSLLIGDVVSPAAPSSTKAALPAVCVGAFDPLLEVRRPGRHWRAACFGETALSTCRWQVGGLPNLGATDPSGLCRPSARRRGDHRGCDVLMRSSYSNDSSLLVRTMNEDRYGPKARRPRCGFSNARSGAGAPSVGRITHLSNSAPASMSTI